ncbi:hypothetical protein ACLOJK_016474 [Asimina triloba]
MEVAIPISQSHFESAPSPKPFSPAYYSYFSAPASPARRSAVYSEFSDWDEKPPRAHDETDAADAEDGDCDFAFDFSGQLETASLTAAEDLFSHGKIRPLRPAMDFSETPKAPVSPKQRKENNPFADATANARTGAERERGRQRSTDSRISSSSRRGTRSLSPLRVSEPKAEQQSSLKGGSRKWRLKDLLLFRSASEGRATDKDRLRKFSVLPPKKEDVKNSSFRSIDGSSGGASGSGSRGGRVSAHERLYTANRAVSEDMKRKTFLPYKQGLLAFLSHRSWPR